MQRIFNMLLTVTVTLTAGLLLGGCGSDRTSSPPFAIVVMDNGATGFEPHILKNGVVTIIKDINPGAGGSNPNGFTAFNGKLYFRAYDGTHGAELWVTDGTAAGTTMVKDINPGAEGSDPYGFTTFNGKLYFNANDGALGSELWVTDGTAAGTSMLKDINPGAEGSNLNGFTAFNGKLYFMADDGSNGTELWVTDGTATGTTIFKDINPGAGSSNPYGFIAFNGKLYFQADDGSNGTELWVTDGTAAGTAMLKDINPGTPASYPYSLRQVVGWGAAYVSGSFDKLLFVASDAAHGNELWTSDGTAAGTGILVDFNPGAGDGFFLGVD